MNGESILVLDGEHPNALPVVQSLARAGYQVKLAGASLSGPAFMSRYPCHKMLYPDPFQNKSEFLSWINLWLKQQDLSGYLFPVTDRTIHPLMEMKRRGQLSIAAFLPPISSFSKIFDKKETMSLAVECGIPIPKTVAVDAPDDTDSLTGISFPCFAKPAFSKVWIGDKGYDLSARMIRTPEELSEAVARITKYCPVLVQEYVPGEGFGVEVLCDKGKPILEFAHKRIHELPLTGGGSCYRISVEIPKSLREASTRLLGQIGWQGLAMVEFKCEGDRFWLMEVNGRVWGSMPLAISAGVDFPRWYAELIIREKRPPGPVNRKIGLYQRKVFRDIVWFRDNFKADKHDRKLHTRPVLRSFLELLRPLVGKEKWDGLSLSDLRPFLFELRELRDIIFRKFRGRINVRRERLLSRKFIEDHSPRKILVLCYGNICRSPYVEKRLRWLLPLPFEIRSAGFYPEPDRSSPRSFMTAVAERNIDLSHHRSHLVDANLIQWADVLLIMDRINWKQVRSLGESCVGKTVWLGAWDKEGATVEIEDPYGQDPEKMRYILDRMDRACIELSKQLLGNHTSFFADNRFAIGKAVYGTPQRSDTPE